MGVNNKNNVGGMDYNVAFPLSACAYVRARQKAKEAMGLDVNSANPIG
jgi:hypothetical protein